MWLKTFSTDFGEISDCVGEISNFGKQPIEFPKNDQQTPFRFQICFNDRRRQRDQRGRSDFITR